MRCVVRRGITRFMSVLVVAATVVAAGAVPAAAQMVPGEPPLANSSNVQLLGHIPGSAAGMVFKGNHASGAGRRC
jgi:hypothetical protein